MTATIRLQQEPFDAAAEARALTHGRTDIGAVVTFTGICPGEDIVLVVTASSHRHDAFAAAEFLMDYLKTRAPFWKRVERATGSAASGSWVDAKTSDDAAADRWSKRPDHD